MNSQELERLRPEDIYSMCRGEGKAYTVATLILNYITYEGDLSLTEEQLELLYEKWDMCWNDPGIVNQITEAVRQRYRHYSKNAEQEIKEKARQEKKRK